MDNENNQRISLYIDKDLVAEIDHYIDTHNYRSRNDFFTHAAELYMTMDEMKMNKTLTDMFGKACEVFAKENVKILGSCLYRYAVDIDMMMRMFAGITNYTKKEIATFRHEAMNNVRRTRGRIPPDDIAAGHYHDVFDEGE